MKRNPRLGKKLSYMDQVNHNSPTCQSSMRERDLFHEALFRSEVVFQNHVKQRQHLVNLEKLNTQAAQNIPINKLTMLYPLPDKHLANTSLDRIHTTRRAQVLSQDVTEEFASPPKKGRKIEGITKPERVFLRSNPKPIETTTTFPEQLIGSNNNYDLFLGRDPQKATVFKNFRNYNRDLTKAYLRQAETASLFEKVKGGALPEHQIKQKKEDDETFNRLGNLFNTMQRRSRYG